MTLCLIIPTCNRPLCIERYLSEIQYVIRQKNIDVVIYDSSDNDSTKDIVLRYMETNKNIFYDQYMFEKDLNAIDYKVYSAYSKYYLQYDFMWFCGDRAILNLVKYYNEIEALAKENYDMIVTDCQDCSVSKNKDYSSAMELFEECFWFMTLLSSVIVSKRMAGNIIARHDFATTKDNYLWLPCVYFNELINDEYKVIHYSNNAIYTVNSMTVEVSFWQERKNAIWQWSTAYCMAIDSLDSYYDHLKPRVLKSFDKHMRLFNLMGLLRFKEDGNLTVQKIKENRTSIKRVTDTSLTFFYVVAFLPIKNLLRVLRKIIKCYKNIINRRKQK